MSDARIGFCCTFVSPSGDEAERRLLNMQQPTIRRVRPLTHISVSREALEAKAKNLASTDLADHVRSAASRAA